MNVIFGLFAFVCTTIGTLALMFSLKGVALQMLWGWFIIPIFHLPPLSLLQAIGVAMVVGFLTKQHIPTSKEPGAKKELILHIFIQPIAAMAIGYIIHLLM